MVTVVSLLQIMDWVGSLDSSRNLQPIYVKSFVNRLHLVLQISKIPLQNFFALEPNTAQLERSVVRGMAGRRSVHTTQHSRPVSGCLILIFTDESIMVAAHLPFSFGRSPRLICTGNELFLSLRLHASSSLQSFQV